MIIFKVDDRTYGRKNIHFSVIELETNVILSSGQCDDFSIVTTKYYNLKDEHGTKNVRMFLR